MKNTKIETNDLFFYNGREFECCGRDKDYIWYIDDMTDTVEVQGAYEGDCRLVGKWDESKKRYEYIENEEQKGIDMLEDERQTDYSYLDPDPDDLPL